METITLLIKTVLVDSTTLSLACKFHDVTLILTDGFLATNESVML